MDEQLREDTPQFTGEEFHPRELCRDERLQFGRHIHDTALLVFRRAWFQPQGPGVEVDLA